MFVELEHATLRPRKESTKSVCAYLVFYGVVLFILLICKKKEKKRKKEEQCLKKKNQKRRKTFLCNDVIIQMYNLSDLFLWSYDTN